MRSVLVVLVTLLAPLALASHTPTGRCADEGTLLEITSGDAAATWYVDSRGDGLDQGFWLYQESNGIWASHGAPGVYSDDLAEHNLQRGGSSPIIPTDVIPCLDDPLAMPDVVLF